MLRRRVIAAALAIVLSGAGAVLLLGYVGRADQRAMAGMETVKVLIVTAPVAEGAAADALGAQVTGKTLPRNAVAPGAVTNLKQVTGRVTTTSLQPGEQLLASRFVDPATLTEPGELVLPAGTQQISMSLPAPQAVGGALKAGDRVSFYAASGDKGSWRRVMQGVLLSKVVGGVVPAVEADGKTEAQPEQAAAGPLMLTFAVTPADAGKIASFGAGVWLTLEPVVATTKGAAPTTAGSATR
jgi:pilus assembly protein CpaB